VHRERDVGGQRPRRRGPGEQRRALATGDRHGNDDRAVRELDVGLEHLVLRDRRAAPDAPRHDAVTTRDPAAAVAYLEEVPDVGHVFVGHRVVRRRPVHPLPELPRLLGLERREAQHAFAARARERLEPHLLDLRLAVHAERALDLHLDPEPLAVEAVLEPLVEAAHRLVPLEDVLVRAAARVVDAHRVVGGDRAIEERPARTTAVLRAEPREDVVTIPEDQRVARERDKVERSRRHDHIRLPWCRVHCTGFRDAEKHHGRQEPLTAVSKIRTETSATVSSHACPALWLTV